MTFAEADAQYEIAKQRYLAGALTDQQYDDQLRGLMVSDDQGRWWAKSRENGNWHYYDTAADSWIASTPPVEPPPLRPPSPAAPAAPPSPQPQSPQPQSPQPQSLRPAAPGSTPTMTSSQAGVPKWAAVVPATHTPATSATSKTAQPPTPVAPPAAGYSAADFRPLPELSGTLKLIFAVLAFLVPVLGIVLFLIYRGKPAQADRAAARLFLILGVVSLALTCLSVTLLGVAGAALWNLGG